MSLNDDQLEQTDDQARALGRVEAVLNGVVTHLRKQDAADEVRDRQRATDKRIAIAARLKLEKKVDAIGSVSEANALWIQTFGIPMVEAEQAKKRKKEMQMQRLKGALGVWTSITATGGLVVGALVWMGKDAIASVLTTVAGLLKGD
jgi:hypothetical protein